MVITKPRKVVGGRAAGSLDLGHVCRTAVPLNDSQRTAIRRYCSSARYECCVSVSISVNVF